MAIKKPACDVYFNAKTAFRAHSCFTGTRSMKKNNCPALLKEDGYFSYSNLLVVIDDHQQTLNPPSQSVRNLIDTTAQQLPSLPLVWMDAAKASRSTILLITNSLRRLKISKQNHAKPIQDNNYRPLLRAAALSKDRPCITTIHR